VITVAVNEFGFQTKFNELVGQVKNPRALLAATGREAGNQLKKHFQEKDKTDANTLAPDRRSHFWLAVSQTVNNGSGPDNPTVSGSTVAISINHPAIAQKVFGGTIFAKEAGALTIPVEERAYGRTANTFEQETGLKLFLIHSGTGNFENALLAVKDAGGKGFIVEYLLTKSVNQKPDPTALPDMASGSPFEQALLDRARTVVRRQIADAFRNQK
jgi:hypothetical protein